MNFEMVLGGIKSSQLWDHVHCRCFHSSYMGGKKDSS